MGRLSLAIGRQKDGADGRGKTRQLRSSLKGLLGMPERASIDLGDPTAAATYSDDQSVTDDAHYHDLQPPATAAGEPGFRDARDSRRSSLARAHAPGERHVRADIAPVLRERKSASAAGEMARAGGDAERPGWRRRGSMLGARLPGSLRREASASTASIGCSTATAQMVQPLVRKESTPQFSVVHRHHQRLASHPEGAENAGPAPLWRGNNALRVASSAVSNEILPDHLEPGAGQPQERTHRSSSVPFLTPLPSTASSQPGPACHGQQQLVSPYLRAVSSGLGRYSPSGRSRASPSGFSGSRQFQDRIPRLSLVGGLEGSSPPGTPLSAGLSTPGDKMVAASSLPMTFLVSPRARANSGSKYGVVVAQPLNTTPGRDFGLYKHTLSSTTIPTLELNAPASPKALTGAVDMSEFGVFSSASTAGSAHLACNPAPVAIAGTPAHSPASTPVSLAFARQRESPDSPSASSDARGGSRPPASPWMTQAADPSARRAADTVHETHRMEVQHDPRTGRKMINQYMIIRELGRGTHGKVKLAFDTVTGEYYAIKVIDKESRGRRLRPAAALAQHEPHSRPRRSHGHLRIDVKKMEKVKREIAILKKCRHPNVVRLREVIDDAHARRIYLVIEYMDGGEVAWRDSDHLPVMSADKARSVFRDLVLGVEYLHYVGILHRDLKPQNLLHSKAGTVKISDFGVSYLSRRMGVRSQRAHPAEGTVAFSVPPAPTADSEPPLPANASHPLVGGPPHRQLGQLHIHSDGQMQRPVSQVVCQRSTIGMTDEFGARAGSQYHSGMRHGGDPLEDPADSSEASPACKLPAEFMSADSSVYDPFDSSDSDEFFSSSDDGSGNESDYGDAAGNAGSIDAHSTGGDAGIVFGMLPPAGDTGSDAGASGSCKRHQRKGTLGEINFERDEKDEERELAKTAGTPAFFAPELCCMPDELAKLLKHERMLRRAAAAAAAASVHHGHCASARASPTRRTRTMHVAGSETEADGAYRRPLSLVVDSPAAGDGARGSPRTSKRHSAITSLLARPFSSKGRPSSRGSSHSSMAPPAAQVDDADSGGSDDEIDQPLPANLITPAIDIWAMGVTLYCLIYGRVPFQASTEFELFSIIPRKALEFPRHLDAVDDSDDAHLATTSGLFGAPDGRAPPRTRRVQLPELDPDARDLLSRMLDKDFRTRITIDEIKRHPWVVKDLEHPTSWAKETDPTCRPSLTITVQEVEQAMVPKVRAQRGFRASVRRRISLLAPRAPRGPRTATAKAKSSLDWLKIW